MNTTTSPNPRYHRSTSLLHFHDHLVASTPYPDRNSLKQNPNLSCYRKGPQHPLEPFGELQSQFAESAAFYVIGVKVDCVVQVKQV